jgi:hypothetical protein
MVGNATYRLKGYGTIDAAWLRECLALFKQQQVNIRRLVVMQNGQPSCYGMVEIHFVLSHQNLPERVIPFLDLLDILLKKQRWREQTLEVPTPVAV